MTFDNDKAFIDYQEIGKDVDVDTYFTRPYSSQDKGTVENRIGVIRRFFPTKTDFTFISHQQVREVEQKIKQ